MSTGQQAISRTSPFVWEFCEFSPLTKLRASLNEGKCDLGSCVVCHCQNFVWLTKGDRVWQIFPLLSLQNATSATTESLWPWSSFALARCLQVDWNHEKFSRQSAFHLVIGNPSAGFDELLISLSSAPSLHWLLGVLFLFFSGSCITCGPLREARDYCRDTLTVPCRLNLPHGGHLEDKLGLDSLLYPVTNPPCNYTNHFPTRIQRYSCTWD